MRQELAEIHLHGEGGSFRGSGPAAEAEADAWLAQAVAQDPSACWVEAHVALLEGFEVHARFNAALHGACPRLRRCLALQRLVRSHIVTLPGAERERCRHLVEELLGPGLRVLPAKQVRQMRRSTLEICACGRRVPWRRASLSGRAVHVLAMHASATDPGTPCSHLAVLYRDLDPLIPRPLGAEDVPPPARRPGAWWAAVLRDVPRHLGGPLRAPKRTAKPRAPAGKSAPLLHAHNAPPTKTPGGVRDRGARTRVEAVHELAPRPRFEEGGNAFAAKEASRRPRVARTQRVPGPPLSLKTLVPPPDFDPGEQR